MTSINSAPEPTKSAKGFFTVSLTQVDNIVRSGGGPSELITYLVLSRGAGRKAYSTWGAGSCAKYTEHKHHRATKSIQWLEKHGFIRDLAEDEFGKSRRKWQFLRGNNDVEVALSNSLIEGVGKGKKYPPMKRIEELPMGRHGGLNEARLDALMVLLHLYAHHLIADYGGIDPRRSIYRIWRTSETEWGDPMTEIPDTNAAMYEICADETSVHLSFAEGALFYVADKEERMERFWDAFQNLRSLGWVYLTMQIWTANPAKDDKAEPWFTLYVHDRHARETDPYLATDIHKAGVRLGVIDGCSAFSEYVDDVNKIPGSGKFRYIARRENGGFPIGIYRLKFRPHTNDTGKGMVAEQRRINTWQKILASL